MVLNRDYKKEILEIIQEHGGKLTGFNYLREKGDFHRTSLSYNLKELEIQNIIFVERKGKGKLTTYHLVKSHYSTKIKINDREIIKIEKILDDNFFFSEEQKSYLIRCIMKISLAKIRNIPLGELSLELTDNYPMPKYELKEARKHYLDIMKKNLRRLPDSTRRKLINSFFQEDIPRDILKQAQDFLKLPSSA